MLKVNNRSTEFQINYDPRRTVAVITASALEKVFGFVPAEQNTLVVYAAGVNLGNHRHDNSREGFLLVAGRVEFKVRAEGGIKTFVLAQPGDSILIPAGAAHVARKLGDWVAVLNAFPEKVWAESGTVPDPVE